MPSSSFANYCVTHATTHPIVMSRRYERVELVGIAIALGCKSVSFVRGQRSCVPRSGIAPRSRSRWPHARRHQPSHRERSAGCRYPRRSAATELVTGFLFQVGAEAAVGVLTRPARCTHPYNRREPSDHTPVRCVPCTPADRTICPQFVRAPNARFIGPPSRRHRLRHGFPARLF
ncbi:hypothetical protein SAMN05192552_103013 [Natrinema hispanicum]|uniref:Uncharacterized protein n=1 Tax=Natrinema hispanicum TaxID=392421 RepID=A0A1G6VNQ0_9EURY|nr:hypothetical protein SAMN05192552_103013 [Natrinema hispanicum]